uniref:P1/s1 nuclease n=1 Tax=Euplotes harpa TaxID=151035 RepID=A0A7S3NEL3_9SPIT|mmetsp:Transcript_42879/g.50288  ORF Transcript_42879/g.50288 Transcript_42879/m.50288 type:complete len:303 (+) Transcript_42879:13-921(+)
MKALVVLLIALSSVSAYWSTGHMIISRIAHDDLLKTAPEVFKQIKEEVRILQQFSKEANHSFVESAVWADDNKDIEFGAFTQWHYVDTPYIMPDFHGETEVENMNVTWAINQMKRTLNNTSVPQFNSDLALSFAWRYLIHLVGDLHQPLHASSMYSKMFSEGDQGGNLFLLKFPANPQITNLHALWDACVDQYGSLYAPLNQTEWSLIGEIASNLTQQTPRSKVADRVRILDEKVWAQESFKFSKDIVYDGINPNDTPSPQYIERGRRFINEQLVVAGYRLSDILKSLHHKRFKTSIKGVSE